MNCLLPLTPTCSIGLSTGDVDVGCCQRGIRRRALWDFWKPAGRSLESTDHGGVRVADVGVCLVRDPAKESGLFAVQQEAALNGLFAVQQEAALNGLSQSSRKQP